MELVKKDITFYDLLLCRSTIYEESTDAIVPDTYPDLEQIVCADGTVYIKDESPQTDRILISGTVNTTVIYRSGEVDSSIRVLSVPLNFAYIEEAKGLTADSVCFVRCQIVSVEASIVNSRKVGVTAHLCFESSVYEQKTQSVTESIEDGEYPLEIRYQTQTVTLPILVTTRSFTVLEDVQISETSEVQIIQKRCTLQGLEKRALHDKIIVKGNALLTFLICRDGQDVRGIQQIIPFAQIFDLPGMEEGQPLQLSYAVKSIDCEPVGDGVLSVGIGADALICAEQELVLQTIADLYQVRFPVCARHQLLHLPNFQDCTDFREEISDTLSDSVPLTRLTDLSARYSGMAQENDSLQLVAFVSAVVADGENRMKSIGRTVKVAIQTAAGLAHPMIQAPSLEISGQLSGEEGIAFRLTASGRLLSGESCMIDDIAEVTLDPSVQNHADPAIALILRYVNQEEALWDIAKHYATTAQAIRDANGLEETAQSVFRRLLLIPVGS